VVTIVTDEINMIVIVAIAPAAVALMAVCSLLSSFFLNFDFATLFPVVEPVLNIDDTTTVCPTAELIG